MVAFLAGPNAGAHYRSELRGGRRPLHLGMSEKPTPSRPQNLE